MGWESSGVVGFDLGPLLEGQMRTAKLKSAYNLLIIGPRGFGALSLRWIQFASVFRCARSSSGFCPIFNVFLHLYEFTSKIEVIKRHNQNMAVLLNILLQKFANGRKYGDKNS